MSYRFTLNNSSLNGADPDQKTAYIFFTNVIVSTLNNVSSHHSNEVTFTWMGSY